MQSGKGGVAVKCVWCDAEIKTKDEIGINLKLLGAGNPDYYCLPCLAEYMDCTVEDLQEKIKQFKEDGCTLFR